MAKQQRSRETAIRLGEEIRRRMDLFGITYDELSLETRIVKSRLHRYAHGENLKWIDPDELEAIANALHTTVDELLKAAGYRLTSA